MVAFHSESRIDPLVPAEATGRIGEIFAESLRQFGKVSNFSQVMAIAPGALEAWMTANRGVRLRYLEEDPEFLKIEQAVIIRTSSVNGSEYCLTHNVELGAEAGLTADQIQAIQSADYQHAPDLSDAMKLAVEWADAVTNMRAAEDDDLFDRMLGTFSQQRIVELTVLCCMWNFSNRFTDALHINPEPEGERLSFRPKTRAS